MHRVCKLFDVHSTSTSPKAHRVIPALTLAPILLTFTSILEAVVNTELTVRLFFYYYFNQKKGTPPPSL